MPIFLTFWFGKTRWWEYNFLLFLFALTGRMDGWMNEQTNVLLDGTCDGWRTIRASKQKENTYKIKQFCRANRDLTFCQKKFSRTRNAVLCAIRFLKLRWEEGKMYIFKINYSRTQEVCFTWQQYKSVLNTFSPRLPKMFLSNVFD